MRPLKIEWTFTSPVILPGHTLHLDGLLAWARVEEAKYDPDPLAAIEDLPLARDNGVWQASQIFMSPASTPFMTHMVRQLELDALALDQGVLYSGEKNSFQKGTGSMKSYNLLFPTQWMNKAEAWCIGDQERVIKLLARVKSLGKKGLNGYGKVRGCKIEPAVIEDVEKWRLRALPPDKGMEMPGVEYAPVIQTLSPPYWDISKRTAAVVPII